MPIRVLYVQSGTGQFAGIERVVDDMATAISNKYNHEFEVDVLFLSPFPGIDFSDRPYRRLERYVRSRFDLLAAAREGATRAEYDVIIVPQVESTVVFWIACLGLGRKIVLHLHGNPNYETSHWKAKILFFVMKAFVVHRLAGIFGTSKHQLEAFNNYSPSLIPKYWVPNPVRTFDNCNEVSCRKPDEGPIFVNVGRFAYQKAQDHLICAFAKVRASTPTARLKLVGHGSDEPRIRQQIQDLALEGSVSVEHYPDTPEVPLRESDVYVSASRWEGWSLAICEALRFGLPVISTNCDFGPNEILVDEKIGRLVPVGDVGALATMMLYYIVNMNEERIHSDFRKNYVARFDLDKVVDIHVDAIRDIVRISATHNVKNTAAAAK